MTAFQRHSTDISPRKRSFVSTTTNNPADIFLRYPNVDDHGLNQQSAYGATNDSTYPSHKRRSISEYREQGMPVHIAPMMSTAYPSFMSVIGSDELSIDNGLGGAGNIDESKTSPDNAIDSLDKLTESRTHTLPFAIQHRDSITSLTTASTSTDSSPTTTYSVFDSPLITDPSPSSSPESATSIVPLSIYNSVMQSSDQQRPQSHDQTFSAPPLNHNLYPEPEVSNTKNVKKLSLNMPNTILSRSFTTSSLENPQTLSEPSSPLKIPLRTGRKKPNNLTIRTPGFQQLTFARTIPDVPPTLSSRPSLQHFQSSPSLPSLSTPTTSSSTGLHLSLPPFSSGHSKSGSDSSFSSQSIVTNLPHLKEVDELSQPHKSQETQERGYPDGPVQIYDCGVFLYLEPTAEEASRFDTVINVAKEIKNPYEENSTNNKTVMSIWRGDAERAAIPEPQTAISEMSFKSAWEFQPLEAPTPTTPRPASVSQCRQPEYLHVEWDHNSEILEDLFPLCRLIDDRVHEGKQVLIHCQLGVSRSASLVIAYGLYKGYQPDFHSMYMQVKDRSKWVGPNMSLIYQLTDFRGKVSRDEFKNSKQTVPECWIKSGFSTLPASKLPESAPPAPLENKSPAPPTEDSAKTPRAAKSHQPLMLNKELPPVPASSGEHSQSLGKSFEAPQSLVNVLQSIGKNGVTGDHKLAPVKSTLSPIQASSRPLPFRLRADYASTSTVPPHSARSVPGPGLNLSSLEPRAEMDLASQDVPPTPALFSPRASEFMASPFGLTMAGDLAAHGPKSAKSVRSIFPPEEISLKPHEQKEEAQPALPTEVDPRSPPPHDTEGGGEILRSIDDIL